MSIFLGLQVNFRRWLGVSIDWGSFDYGFTTGFVFVIHCVYDFHVIDYCKLVKVKNKKG